MNQHRRSEQHGLHFSDCYTSSQYHIGHGKYLVLSDDDTDYVIHSADKVGRNKTYMLNLCLAFHQLPFGACDGGMGFIAGTPESRFPEHDRLNNWC